MQKTKILIVDDEKNYLIVLSAFLSGEGYETLTAASGADALDTLEAADLDLVLKEPVGFLPIEGGSLHRRLRNLGDLCAVVGTAGKKGGWFFHFFFYR